MITNPGEPKTRDIDMRRVFLALLPFFIIATTVFYFHAVSDDAKSFEDKGTELLWFVWAKVFGYSLFAMLLKFVYAANWTQVVRFVLWRTLAGLLIGSFLWSTAGRFTLFFLPFLRYAVWSVMIGLFFDRERQRRGRTILFSLIGVLFSFLLDFLAVGTFLGVSHAKIC